MNEDDLDWELGEPPKHMRPNGLSLDQYKGHERWSYRRWAWEFLRRDDEFIQACACVDQKLKTEAEVAKKYHLMRFKHCNMPYQSAKSPAPKFKADSIQVWGNLRPTLPHAKYSFELEPGQFIVKFDLNHESKVAGSLDAQIRAATYQLKMCLMGYSQVASKESVKTRKPEKKNFLNLLRRLDAVESQKGINAGLMAIDAKAFEDLESDERSKKASSLMRTPREYAKDIYLTLAIHASK